MTHISVTNPGDARLAPYRSLTDVALRRVLEPEQGLYIAESLKVLERAIAAGHRVQSVLSDARWLPQLEGVLGDRDVDVYVVASDVAEQLTGYHVHRGVLAAMERPVDLPLADVVSGARRVLVLEDLVDHTNVGAAFRAAAGLGADAVLVSERCADPLYRRSVRVSMGTVFQVPWTRLGPWSTASTALREHGFVLAALALADDAIPLDEFSADPPGRIALLLGAEGDGLSRRALLEAEVAVTIPMHGGVDSLNVAAAASVALWALRPDPA